MLRSYCEIKKVAICNHDLRLGLAKHNNKLMQIQFIVLSLNQNNVENEYFYIGIGDCFEIKVLQIWKYG